MHQIREYQGFAGGQISGGCVRLALATSSVPSGEEGAFLLSDGMTGPLPLLVDLSLGPCLIELLPPGVFAATAAHVTDGSWSCR